MLYLSAKSFAGNSPSPPKSTNTGVVLVIFLQNVSLIKYLYLNVLVSELLKWSNI